MRTFNGVCCDLLSSHCALPFSVESMISAYHKDLQSSIGILTYCWITQPRSPLVIPHIRPAIVRCCLPFMVKGMVASHYEDLQSSVGILTYRWITQPRSSEVSPPV